LANTVILSQYPVSQKARQNLQDMRLHDVEYLVISNIVHSGYRSLLVQLRNIRCERLIILLAPLQSSTMLSILRLISLMIRADERCYMKYGEEIRRWGMRHVFADIFSILFGVARGLFNALFFLLYFLSINRKGHAKVSIRQALKSKRILYLRPTLWNGLRAGGAVSHARGVIHGLLDLGYSVECMADDEFTNISEDKGNINIIGPKHAFVVPRELNFFNFQTVFVDFVKKTIGDHFSGIIYQRVSVAGVAGVVLSRFWRAPLVLEYNGSESWLAKNWGSPFFFDRLVSFVELSLLRHAHLIVTVSSPLKTELLARGVPDNRIIVCPNGVEIEEFASGRLSKQMRSKERALLGFAEDDLIFTFVGSFGPWHGARLLASIVDNIAANPAEYAVRIKFLFVGQGVESDAIEDMLQEHIKSGRVTMTGLVEHASVPNFLDISDVCLAPTLQNADGSEFFGSPTKLFEYMAAGKPVIASAVGQVKEVMRGSPYIKDLPPGEAFDMTNVNMGQATGLLFKPSDKGQLERAILMLAGNDAARAKMGAVGAARAKSTYTWQAHVGAVLARLDDIGGATDQTSTTVLINALHSKSGGGVTYLRNILPHLAAMPELDIHVALHKSQRPLFEAVLKGSTPHYFESRGGLAGLIMAEQFSLLSTSRRISSDVVFSVANYGPLLVRNGCLLLRNSLDVAIVERRLSKLLYWSAIYLATISSALLAKRVIAVSSYARDSSLRGVFRALREKVVIVPHGVAKGFLDIKRQAPQSPFLLAVSDIYVQKNMHTLIRSFAKLHHEMPELTLKIAGKPIDQEYYQRLKNLVVELNVTQSVHFIGHASGDELRALYGSCSVFVFSSNVETFGNPLVEAMSAGCPIVCSNATAMPSVAGDAVRFVDPNNKDQMAHEIRAFLKDAALSSEYSDRARARGRMFSWEKTARSTADVLLQVANE
tara:strand:+ start:9789 stop:12608 length:2820 start_codon:yes stop_codon:yes gene_type:complete